MFLRPINGYWYLQQKQKDINDEWFDRTIACFGKTKPSFHIPFIYRGCAEDLISSLKNKSINLILTDPPYGITQNRWDIKPDWKQTAEQFNRILKDNGQIAIFGTIPNIIDVFNGFQELFDFRFEIIWNKGKKTAMWTSNYLPLRTHENIFVFKKKDIEVSNLIFNLKLIGKKEEPYQWKRAKGSSNYGEWDEGYITKSDGIRYPISIINENGLGGNDKEYLNFPTQKPEKLIEFFIRGLTNPNDVVADPYLGSGTIAKIAMENARLGLGAEIDPYCFPIIEKRLKSVIKHYNGKNIRWQLTNGFLKQSLPNMTEGWT